MGHVWSHCAQHQSQNRTLLQLYWGHFDAIGQDAAHSATLTTKKPSPIQFWAASTTTNNTHSLHIFFSGVLIIVRLPNAMYWRVASVSLIKEFVINSWLHMYYPSASVIKWAFRLQSIVSALRLNNMKAEILVAAKTTRLINNLQTLQCYAQR